jgi:hypothetical protein
MVSTSFVLSAQCVIRSLWGLPGLESTCDWSIAQVGELAVLLDLNCGWKKWKTIFHLHF